MLVPGSFARDKQCMVFSGWLDATIAFALPPRCPGCGTIVDADHRFCHDCWQALDLLTGDGCALCNVPLGAAAGSVCAPCLAEPPRHDGVRAAVAYGDIARTVALGLKYGRRTGLARTMAAVLHRHLDHESAGILVPVPLHRWRLWTRGFNQSSVVARSLAQRTGLTCRDDILVRKRATGSMRGLSGRKRADMVRGAFRTTTRIDGQTIWLVDDVYTSGATANACAAALKRAGAARVVVLAWARVLRED